MDPGAEAIMKQMEEMLSRLASKTEDLSPAQKRVIWYTIGGVAPKIFDELKIPDFAIKEFS